MKEKERCILYNHIYITELQKPKEHIRKDRLQQRVDLCCSDTFGISQLIWI
jgi:hypothetical protein